MIGVFAFCIGLVLDIIAIPIAIIAILSALVYYTFQVFRERWRLRRMY